MKKGKQRVLGAAAGKKLDSMIIQIVMKKDKPRMGRIPIPRPGNAHKDKSKYDRKVKHERRKHAEEIDNAGVLSGSAKHGVLSIK